MGTLDLKIYFDTWVNLFVFMKLCPKHFYGYKFVSWHTVYMILFFIEEDKV